MTTDLMAAAAELCKMGLQLAGALLVAWLAVQWALSRYKSEKMWERETTAILDVLTALGDIEEMLGLWLKDEYETAIYEGDDHLSNEQLQFRKAEATRRTERYRAARIKLGNVVATAAIILPGYLLNKLAELTTFLDASPPDDDYAGAYEADIKHLKSARDVIVDYGRSRVRR